MEYNFDRAIRLEADPEFKGLYRWALQETVDGQKVGRDQIPWAYSHSFFATELTLHEGYVAKEEFEAKGHWIRAKLTPSGGRYRAPVYSMFGTDRDIELIQLFIHPAQDDAINVANEVSASGWPSYTDTDPLSGSTQPDLLQFNLSVSPEEFDRIAHRLAAGHIDMATFRFHADGFYSAWTPDAESNAFKVLCHERRMQKVDIPEDFSIPLPRVGKVWDAAFSIERIARPAHVAEIQRAKAADNEADLIDPWGDPTPVEPTVEPLWVKPLFAELRTLKTLMGVVVAALVLGLLFK